MADDESGEIGAIEGTHAGGNPGDGAAGGAAGRDGDLGGDGPGDLPAVDQARAAKVGATRATVEAAMAGLVGEIGAPGEPEQPSLMLDDMDEQMALFSGPVRHVASTIAAARGRGRPKGSQNKNAFRDVLLRMGYRHPGLNLAAMANADPLALAVELAALPVVDGATPQEHLHAAMATGALKRDQVIALIRSAHDLMAKANAELLPYFESKRPTEIEVTERKLGVMIVGDMRTERQDDGGYVDLTRVEKPE